MGKDTPQQCDVSEQTKGFAGEEGQCTVVQNITGGNCTKRVTPAPAKEIGTVEYYFNKNKQGQTSGWLSRHYDFINRHQSCSHTVPNYYEHYGFKYISLFTETTYNFLSDRGKEWLIDARLYLQQYMEWGFKQNLTTKSIKTHSKADDKVFSIIDVKELQALELDSDNFRKFAFGTHPAAYIDAGMKDLPALDLIYVALTPDMKEWYGPGYQDTFAQALEVGMHFFRKKTALELAALLFDLNVTLRYKYAKILHFIFVRYRDALRAGWDKSKEALLDSIIKTVQYVEDLADDIQYMGAKGYEAAKKGVVISLEYLRDDFTNDVQYAAGQAWEGIKSAYDYIKFW